MTIMEHPAVMQQAEARRRGTSPESRVATAEARGGDTTRSLPPATGDASRSDEERMGRAAWLGVLIGIPATILVTFLIGILSGVGVGTSVVVGLWVGGWSGTYLGGVFFLPGGSDDHGSVT